MDDITKNLLKASAVEAKTRIIDYFKINTSTKIYWSVIIILGLIVLFSVRTCNNKNVELNTLNQNVSSLSDSIRISKNKAGELEASKGILISDKNKLEEMNKDLYDELKKEKGKVFELNRIIATLGKKPNDTIIIDNTVIKYANGVYGLEWKYDTTYSKGNNRSIHGTSKFRIYDTTKVQGLQTEITTDVVSFKLITGLKEKDGKLEIFVRSDYPNFYVTELDGAIIDPAKHPLLKDYTKKKRWGIGPYVGFGIGSNLRPSVQIGVGIQYNFIRF